MHTTATRLLRLLPLLLVPLALLAAAEEAAAQEATVTYPLGSPDPSGVNVQIGGGLVGCGGTCATLRVSARAALSGRRQALLQYAVPVGTAVARGSVRLQLRTRHPGVVVKVLARLGQRWVETARVRSTQATVRQLRVPAGAGAVAVALVVEGRIARNAVRAESDNAVAVQAVELVVRDLARPTVSWLDDPAEPGRWQRGPLCATALGEDVGLGVERLEYRVGPATAESATPLGSRLQPRPRRHEARLCVDSATLPDGAYGTAIVAHDAGGPVLSSGSVVRVDNTPPEVDFSGPQDGEARLPEMRLDVQDPASGVADVQVAVDGFPAELRPTGSTVRFVPPQALADGLHRVTWTVVDVAGNVTADAAVVSVHDATEPSIAEVAPEGITTADAIVSARLADAGSGLAPDGVRVAVDGVDLSLAADLVDGLLRLSPPVAWAPGRHEVRISAVDRSGNRALRSWWFEVPAPPAPVPAEPVAPLPGDGDGLSGDAPQISADGLRLRVAPRLRLRARSAVLAVRVSTAEGLPAVGVRVLAQAERGGLSGARTDEDGVARLRITRAMAGQVTVEAGEASTTFVVEALPVLRLTASARTVAVGAVVTLRGRAERGARVAIEARAGGRWVVVARVRARVDGAFSSPVRLPAAGAYAVRARSGDGLSGALRLRAR